MKLVQHPFVVRLYDVIDTQTKLYLVLEFADGGDMYDYIMRHEGGLKVKSKVDQSNKKMLQNRKLIFRKKDFFVTGRNSSQIFPPNCDCNSGKHFSVCWLEK